MKEQTEAKVQEYMESREMPVAGRRLFLAVSGGADSTALLLIMAALAERMHLRLTVLHVEHGIRGAESTADAAFVQALAERMGIPFAQKRICVPELAAARGTGLEETAREERYRFFRQMAQEEPSAVCLAHHMEDNAETILFQETRGAGLRGLTGIQPVTEMQGVLYLRPLLGLTRAEIEQYLTECGQEWRTDSTNADTDVSRNRIRHRVLPELKQINPRAVEHLNHTAEQLTDILSYMDLETERQMKLLVKEENGRLRASRQAISELHPAIRRALLLKMLETAAGHRKDLTSGHVKDLEELLALQSGRRLPMPYGVEARNEFSELVLEKRRSSEKPEDAAFFEERAFPPLTEGGCGRIEAGGFLFDFRLFRYNGDATAISKKKYTKWFDYDKIRNGLVIRSRQAGDYMILDDEQHRKTIRKLMIDDRIPRENREGLPLVVSQSEVLWVPGSRCSATGRVVPETVRILEIKCEKENNHGFSEEI